MFTEIINGKEVNCKLKYSAGIIHFGNYKELGIQIYPNEEKLKVNFGKDPLIYNERSKRIKPEETEFYNNYWIERKTHDQVIHAIEKIDCLDIKGDLLLYMQQAKTMLGTFIFPEDSDIHYRDNMKLKEFFENLEDKDFKIINFKMTCEKKGVAKNYKIEYEWLIDRLRERLIEWKNKNDDYDYFIGDGQGLAMKGYKHNLYMKSQKYTIYKVVVDYFYINTAYKSINDICKKTGILFAALEDLPSEEYYIKKIKPNLKYNNYQEYLADRVLKIIKRPV